MSDLLRIGNNSLLAYQAAMSVIGQNIANVATPYYSRRVVSFKEGAFNNGVSIGDVNRIYDQTTSQNLQAAQGALSAADIHQSSLLNLEALIDTSISDDPTDPSGTSIGKYLTDVINGLNQLNTNPQSIQARQLYLSQISNLVTRINQISGSIQLQYADVNAQILGDTNQVNQITAQLAQINTMIKSTGTQDTSALLDQRERLLQELGTYIDFEREELPDGEENITLSNGMPLVLGINANTMSTMTDPLNPNNQDVTVIIGTAAVNVGSIIHSGELGGLISFRGDLDDAQHSVGRLALGLASVLNNQNKLGVDLRGNLGVNLVTDLNDSGLVASRGIANINNAGTATVSVSIQNLGQLTTSDYTLTFDAANHYQIMRISDGSLVSSGNLAAYPATIAVDGLQVTINAGTFQVGDTFRLSPTSDAAQNLSLQVTDPSALALGFPVSAAAKTSNGGTGVIEVSSMVNTATPEFSLPMQLNPPITIQFLSATTYQIVNANTSAVMEGPITYNPTTGASVFPTPGGYDPGYRVTLTGEIVAGDLFTLQYNSNPSGDNRNGRLLSETIQQGLLDNGTNSLTQAYNVFATDLSSRVYSAQIAHQSADLLATQAQNQYAQLSGVSLEEETINLAQYQQAYQASAQILEAARNVFEALLMISRGA